MSRFTKSIVKEYDYDGDHLVVIMERMKRKDAVKIVPYLGEPNEDGTFKMTFEQQMAFLDKAGDIIQGYVRSIEGLIIDDVLVVPNASSAEDNAVKLVFRETYFMNLLSQILSDLMEVSFISGDEEKKSDEQHNDTSEGSETWGSTV